MNSCKNETDEQSSMLSSPSSHLLIKLRRQMITVYMDLNDVARVNTLHILVVCL